MTAIRGCVLVATLAVLGSGEGEAATCPKPAGPTVLTKIDGQIDVPTNFVVPMDLTSATGTVDIRAVLEDGGFGSVATQVSDVAYSNPFRRRVVVDASGAVTALQKYELTYTSAGMTQVLASFETGLGPDQALVVPPPPPAIEVFPYVPAPDAGACGDGCGGYDLGKVVFTFPDAGPHDTFSFAEGQLVSNNVFSGEAAYFRCGPNGTSALQQVAGWVFDAGTHVFSVRRARQGSFSSLITVSVDALCQLVDAGSPVCLPPPLDGGAGDGGSDGGLWGPPDDDGGLDQCMLPGPGCPGDPIPQCPFRSDCPADAGGGGNYQDPPEGGACCGDPMPAGCGCGSSGDGAGWSGLFALAALAAIGVRRARRPAA